MASKNILKAAQRIAALKVIPEQMLPSTLKFKIELPKFTKIVLSYGKSVKQFGPAFSFYRTYVADIRYHNPGLIMERNRDSDDKLVAEIQLHLKDNMQPIIVETATAKSIEQLKDTIIEKHKSLV